MNTLQKLSVIEEDIEKSKIKLEQLYEARKKASEPITRLTEPHPLLIAAAVQPQQYRLLAQGDSWFDYLPGKDLIEYLRHRHGHIIENIGVGGSTLNDIVYGPVPKNWLGIPQSHDVSRIAELIHLIEKIRPHAILLSGGGNDIAGQEFFSLINNALSNLENPNKEVIHGVLFETFRKAYEDLIGTIKAKAEKLGITLPIFVHGYDYPWPDGRGVTMFNLVGPWFDDTFNKKNYPYKNNDKTQLGKRYEVVKVFIDEFNGMLKELASSNPQSVYYVDLRNTLTSKDDWANELHPTNDGFLALSDKFNFELHKVLINV
ncbi:MAG: SGNH/GDSL hydrolase family protein [Gallionella sp.]|nr:SGNH/GDSL hydrolase family protein [Gallionella sp.]MDD4946084.1 SGNH/GDSL hydrolase family protein [Gallionella sp.]